MYGKRRPLLPQDIFIVNLSLTSYVIIRLKLNVVPEFYRSHCNRPALRLPVIEMNYFI